MVVVVVRVLVTYWYWSFEVTAWSAWRTGWKRVGRHI